AFKVPNVLNQEECDAIIQICELKGFEQALLNVGRGEQVLRDDVRKSGRCVIDDVDAAEIVMGRLEHAIPGTYHEAYNDCSWRCVGLNERFRVLKYEEGDYFCPHRDGSYQRTWENDSLTFGEPGDASFYTLMLYLNEPARGGRTNFISVRGDVSSYCPRAGEALVFDHGVRHEGERLESGVKYAIRTDVMYRKDPVMSEGE
ncbi:hypothetical protein ACHAWF_007876, partial [Thalassiosira exigua]